MRKGYVADTVMNNIPEENVSCDCLVHQCLSDTTMTLLQEKPVTLPSQANHCNSMALWGCYEASIFIKMFPSHTNKIKR